MGRIILIFAAATFCGVSVFAQAQGGMMGGQQQRQSDVQQIDQRIGLYLNGDELKSVLTPGEFVEYKLNIKSGQVLFAGASSEAFDAALEIVDAKNNVLASNDD